MTIEETLSIGKTFLMIATPIGLAIFTGLAGYANKQAKQIYELDKNYATLDARLKAEEILMDHIVKSGENIKDRLDNHDLMINEIKIEFKYMKESLDKILKILETK